MSTSSITSRHLEGAAALARRGSDASSSSTDTFRHSHKPAPFCGGWTIPRPSLRAFINFFKRLAGSNSTPAAPTPKQAEKPVLRKTGTRGTLQPQAPTHSETKPAPKEPAARTLQATVQENLLDWIDDNTDAARMSDWIIAANEWDSGVDQADKNGKQALAAEAPSITHTETDPISQEDHSRTEQTAVFFDDIDDKFDGEVGPASGAILSKLIETGLIRHQSVLVGRGKHRIDENDPQVQHLKKLWMQRAKAVENLLEGIGYKGELINFPDIVHPKPNYFWQNPVTTSEEIFKNYEEQLIKFVARHLQATGERKDPQEARAEAEKLYRRAIVENLNQQEWTTITKSITYKGQEYTVEQTPAAQIKRGGHNIFEHDYQGRGVACGTTDCVKHATNLWQCELRSPNGETLFSGVRTGVLSPYGLKHGSEERKEGAINRAKEVLTESLALQPDLLRQAIEGDTVALPLVSVALLTPMNFRSQREGDMLVDQMAAWQALNGKDVELQIRDADGELKKVHVKPEIAAFNFGVNETAMAGNLLDMGWKHANSYNRPAMKVLLGDPDAAQPGGMVGRYLETHPNAPNAPLVRNLAQQVLQMWKDGSYRSDGNEVYKMAMRLTLLSYQIRVTPHWNCKSGKDRTAGNAAEVLREAIQLHQGEELMRPGSELNPEQQELLNKTMLDSGNAEIQTMNTGAPGNKIMKKFPVGFMDLSHKKRIGGEQAFKEVKGLSGVVKS